MCDSSKHTVNETRVEPMLTFITAFLYYNFYILTVVELPFWRDNSFSDKKSVSSLTNIVCLAQSLSIENFSISVFCSGFSVAGFCRALNNRSALT